MTGSAAITKQAAIDERSFGDDWSLRVEVRRDGGGKVLAREQVGPGDLAEARAEAWFNGYLRRGAPQAAFESLAQRLAPVVSGGRCLGFVMEVTDQDGRRHRQAFGVSALAPCAQRAADRLVAQKVLATGDLFRFSIRPERDGVAGGAPDDGGVRGVRVTAQARPLRYRTATLAPLLAGARTVGTLDDDAFTVVMTESAHRAADRFARKGAGVSPPVETGALLVGSLVACPASGEMAVVVQDAIEVHDATQREFALVYTSRTWSRVEAILRRFDEAHDPRRLVGQAHGHNFALDGEPCADCATAPECARTTVFVSAADRSFMRTVFARQPWAICWIAGTNMRGDNIATLYTIDGGVLRARGYHVVADEVLTRLDEER